MIQFTKLRLHGFKSFVDKADLEIGPGLNGIVGPNGCGKSNLVEALRWIMGESSAKRMRGGGMEDVIFAGTDRRSPRNFAEVSLLLDNTTRMAPATYNNTDELEISRKIEKDKGSGYRINGKSVRARDVQMLFADTITGANSPSMVSQGRVTRMINSKPQERRLVLEESAGIAGLYARRHEAELRLKGADANLVRVEDIVGSMESRLNSLKRQSRQAMRYKNISAEIRQLELAVTYLEWLALIHKQREHKTTFAELESAVAQKLTTVSQLTKTQNTQIEELPPLRKAEAEISATLQKHKLDFQRFEDELARYKNDLADTKTQLEQTQTDKAHEQETLDETSKLLSKVEGEYEVLIQEQEQDEVLDSEKSNKADALKDELTKLEEKYSALKEDATANSVRLESLKNQVERHHTQKELLEDRLKTLTDDLSACHVDEGIVTKISQIETELTALDEEIDALHVQKNENIDALQVSETSIDALRQIASEKEKQHTHICAEISVLDNFFSEDDSTSVSVLGEVKAKAGFEKALSRALGDSLLASLDSNAPTFWKKVNIDSESVFPEDVKPMITYVQAPEELHLALSFIGYVETDEDGQRLSAQLKPGQSLVSAEGAYWRWDGYYIQDSATDRHAVYLEQKNKQEHLNQQRETISAELITAQDALKAALDDRASLKGQQATCLETISDKERLRASKKSELQDLKDSIIHTEANKKRYEEQIQSVEEDLKALVEVLKSDESAYEATLSVMNSDNNSEDVIAKVKAQLEQTKELYREAVRDFDLFVQARNTRRARIQAIADERLSLKNRNIRAKEYLKELSGRFEQLTEKFESLKNNPISVSGSNQEMLDKINELEHQKNAATEKLAACEQEVSVTSKALKEAESVLGEAREKRAHAQALLAAVNDQISEMEEKIVGKHNMPAKDLINQIDKSLIDYTPQDLPKLKKDYEKSLQARNAMGAVNLRAEEEALELEKEFGGLLHERNDLNQAIEELRGGINKINKEARERLLVAFDTVNAHFQDLFVRLFGGGKAHLKLVDSDDPLGAGLEIFAQPPGKALQSLSLMSGGEQTLASIALIFGMFLTNPSPICVLDEIDAALDDANVDRVCDLLEEIAERGETRFLVVTHHRLTMARMDRLYGVTMSEKGVSQLVSVDLQKSFDFIDQKVA
ncbi:MAG: chromosome segregation protein SMC [Alcanivorax sp.]